MACRAAYVERPVLPELRQDCRAMRDLSANTEGFAAASGFVTIELCFNFRDEVFDVGGLRKIAVNVLADALLGGLEAWVTGKDKIPAFRVADAHGGNDKQAVRLLVDIKVGQEHVKTLIVYLGQRMGHAAHRLYLKAMLSENQGQSQADAFFVVHEQHTRLILSDHKYGRHYRYNQNVKDVQN